MQLRTETRNAMLNAIETDVGTSPKLYIRTGAAPANCAAADGAGTLIVTIDLPSDWLAAASGGSKAMTGTWPATAATGAATHADAPFHYRIKDSSGTTCYLQGSCTKTGDGGEMTLQNDEIAVGQNVTITGFTLTAGNA